MKKLSIYLIIVIDFIVLLIQIPSLSISFNEASLLYGEFSFLQLIVNISLFLFGNNDFALRFPMIFMHTLSLILLYKLSIEYLSSQRNRIWLVVIFALLPGSVSAGLLVNDAGVIIFGLFLFAYVYRKKFLFFSHTLLVLYLFVSPGFIYLYLGMIVFYIYTHQIRQALFNFALFLFSMYMYGFKTYGIPKGHFLDTLGVYAAIFTPIIFIFIVYALYRRYLIGKTDFIWYISSTTLIFSLLLSLRQKIQLEYFAPYLMIALPQVAQTFVHSYRIRLPQFRKRYKLMFGISLFLLSLNYIVVIFNKELYAYIENPKKHFAYKSHVAKELAQELHKKNIKCVSTNTLMQLRLKFYGIEKCSKILLQENDFKKDVTISYRGDALYQASVTKINNNKSN